MDQDIKRISEVLLTFLTQFAYQHGITRAELKKLVDDACATADSTSAKPIDFLVAAYDAYSAEQEGRR